MMEICNIYTVQIHRECSTNYSYTMEPNKQEISRNHKIIDLINDLDLLNLLL